MLLSQEIGQGPILQTYSFVLSANQDFLSYLPCNTTECIFNLRSKHGSCRRSFIAYADFECDKAPAIAGVPRPEIKDEVTMCHCVKPRPSNYAF
jgi:hypothetical protein